MCLPVAAHTLPPDAFSHGVAAQTGHEARSGDADMCFHDPLMNLITLQLHFKETGYTPFPPL